MENIGKEIFKTIKKLFPINRSLTGEGNRKTLRVLNSVCKNLKILEFKSGTKAYDWRVPEEWNAKNAYIPSKKSSQGRQPRVFSNVVNKY